MKRNTLSTPIDANEEMMNIADAALFCKISQWAMYKRVKRGQTPFHKIGKRLYFLKSELIAYTLNS